MPDPFQHFTADRIADATGAPLANVEQNWPRIVEALDHFGIYERDVCLGVLATIAIETASTFAPVKEAFWLGDDYRASLRYAPYWGRGFVQLTWETNYQAATDALGWDVVAHPDLALDPQVAAYILAWFWATKGVKSKDGTRWYSLPDLCRQHDWEWVRRVVQGGTDGLDRLMQIVSALDGGATVAVTYNRNEPAHPQEDSFDCSQESLEWALYALGRRPDEGWLEPTMIAEGVMSPQQGLLDASGAGLAAFVRRQYGEFGFDANNEPSVDWAWAAHEGAANADGSGHGYPVLLGGRRFGAEGHWIGLKDYDPARGVLLIANPANGFDGIGQTLTQAQFEARGPWSAVRIWHPDLLAAEPAPPPPLPPSPPKMTVEELRAGIQKILSLSDAEHAARSIRADLSALYDKSA